MFSGSGKFLSNATHLTWIYVLVPRIVINKENKCLWDETLSKYSWPKSQQFKCKSTQVQVDRKQTRIEVRSWNWEPEPSISAREKNFSDDISIRRKHQYRNRTFITILMPKEVPNPWFHQLVNVKYLDIFFNSCMCFPKVCFLVTSNSYCCTG